MLLADIDRWVGKCKSPEMLAQVEKWCRERREELAQEERAKAFREGRLPGVGTKEVYRPVEGGA
jgi:hypothetical protein